MSKYIVYTKKDCKCTTPGYFPTEEEARKCAYCKGCRYILKEVDLEEALLRILIDKYCTITIK